MYLLDPDELSFPDPKLNHPKDGLMAIGGDLSVERLLFAYQIGLFPWYNPDEDILWWCPNERFVLFPTDIKVSKSMKQVFKKQTFTFTQNQCFAEVMQACMNIHRPDQDGTWINPELIDSFVQLHHMGHAHSVEVWHDGLLVGGFYGLAMGKVFCGESMFSRMSNASKAALIYFVGQNHNKYSLIDCQIHSEHLESLGARMIPKSQFLDHLPHES